MNTIKRIGAKALLLAMFLAISPGALALGLGDASVQSYLDQPLRVKIDLISSEADDLSSVSAKLASAGDYELILSLIHISEPTRQVLVSRMPSSA